MSGRKINLMEAWERGEQYMTPEKFIQREELTELQSMLMLLAMNSLHTTLNDHGAIPVFHLFIYTTPDWYISSVSELIQHSIDRINSRAIVLGRTPMDGSYSGSLMNNHSGGHFTADFNKFWADAVYDSLRIRTSL
jgi:hypothetical protein